MRSLAVIGAGKHSRLHHGAAIRTLRHQLDRVVIADINLTAAVEYEKTFGLDKAYDDAEKMIEKERPDAIVLVTPEAVTARMVRALLPYQLPMLVEKPFGETVEQTEELCHLTEASGGRIMISFNRRFAPVCCQIQTWMQARFGERPPMHIRAAILRHQRFDSNFLSATAIHVIDMVLGFAGAHPDAVQVQVSRSDRSSPPAVSAQLHFQNGLTSEILIHSACGQLAELYEIFGPGYRISADYFSGARVYESEKHVESFDLPHQMPLAEREGAIEEMKTFLARVETGETFSPVPSDALMAAKVTHLLEQCTKAGGMPKGSGCLY